MTCPYAGTTSVKVTVISRRYSEHAKVYAAIDGKDADGAEVEYTGEAIEPAVVAKADGSTLTEGEDYNRRLHRLRGQRCRGDRSSRVSTTPLLISATRRL